MRRFGHAIACLLIFSIVLAGCSGSTDTSSSTGNGGAGGAPTSKAGAGATTSKGPAGGAGGSTGSGGGSTGGSGGGSGNRAPTGSVVADIPQGAIPVNVTFSLKGSDPDGDAITWNLDWDGDGKTDATGKVLPDSAKHSYTAVGSYKGTFAISDAKGASNSYPFTVNATAAAAAAGPIQTVDGGYVAGLASGCAANAFINGLPADVDHVGFDLDVATIGKPYTITFTTSAPAANYLIQFWAGTNSVVQTDQPTSSPASATVPDGADNVIISSCGGASVTFHYEA
ncbi:MAG: PKD domain-containing protein [Thermoplasmatota archaeon]|nr:hypothetical protein [Halobacteriales archaeon]